jgi:aminoglycoside/choline kinase family phosphotransferase
VIGAEPFQEGRAESAAIVCSQRDGHQRTQQIGNIVSTLFLAEQDVSFDSVVVALADLFDREEVKQAVSILVNWFRKMITHGRLDRADYAALATTLQSIEEVTSMFLKTVERENTTTHEPPK